MMRIGIISDTHRFTKAIDHAIPYLQDCDLIVHAGDNIDDADYIEAVTDIPVVAVKGNCDLYNIDEPYELTFKYRYSNIWTFTYTILSRNKRCYIY